MCVVVELHYWGHLISSFYDARTDCWSVASPVISIVTTPTITASVGRRHLQPSNAYSSAAQYLLRSCGHTEIVIDHDLWWLLQLAPAQLSDSMLRSGGPRQGPKPLKLFNLAPFLVSSLVNFTKAPLQNRSLQKPSEIGRGPSSEQVGISWHATWHGNLGFRAQARLWLLPR